MPGNTLITAFDGPGLAGGQGSAAVSVLGRLELQSEPELKGLRRENESRMEHRSTCRPWRSPHHSRGLPEGEWPLWGLCWSRFAAGPVTPGDIQAGAAAEELQPVGRTRAGEIQGGLSPVGQTPGCSRGSRDSLQPVGQPMVGQLCPAACGAAHGGTALSCSLWRTRL